MCYKKDHHVFSAELITLLILITFASCERLPVDNVRAKTIAIEQILWDAIKSYQNFKDIGIRDRIIKKIVKNHDELIHNEYSIFNKNWSIDYFEVLNGIPKWKKSESRILLVENKFNQFRKLLLEAREKNASDFLEEFNTLATDLDEIWNTLLQIVTFKPDNCFYAVLKTVSIYYFKSFNNRYFNIAIHR